MNWGEGTAGSSTPGIGGAGNGFAAAAGDATWNTPTFGSGAWTNPGATGDFNAAASAFGRRHRSGRNRLHLAFHPGLVSDVQSWLNNPVTNFGWALINANEAANATVKAFYSRSATQNSSGGTLDPAFRPMLTITYIPEPSAAILLSCWPARWQSGTDVDKVHVMLQAFATRSNLRTASRLPTLSSEAKVSAAELATLLACGALAALAIGLLHLQFRVPGHAILRAVLPMAFGLALVPRRSAGDRHVARRRFDRRRDEHRSRRSFSGRRHAERAGPRAGPRCGTRRTIRAVGGSMPALPQPGPLANLLAFAVRAARRLVRLGFAAAVDRSPISGSLPCPRSSCAARLRAWSVPPSGSACHPEGTRTMIYVGIDDTDTLDDPGTNQLARHLVRELAGSYTGRHHHPPPTARRPARAVHQEKWLRIDRYLSRAGRADEPSDPRAESRPTLRPSSTTPRYHRPLVSQGQRPRPVRHGIRTACRQLPGACAASASS